MSSARIWSATRPQMRVSTGVLRQHTSSQYPFVSDVVSRSLNDNSPLANLSRTADELPRIIHDLGPRYVSRFQAADLIRFLTYEAATALNIHLYARAEQARGSAAEVKSLINSFKNGLGINESSLIFSIAPAITQFENKETGEPHDAAMENDVFVARCNGLDLAMWEIGGAAVALRLVQLAQNQHEVSRALGVLTDGLRNSWQNSEDMEQLRRRCSCLRQRRRLTSLRWIRHPCGHLAQEVSLD